MKTLYPYLILTVLSFESALTPSVAQAAARGRPQPPSPGPTYAPPPQTTPVRGVLIKPVGTRPFDLPNQKDPIQLNADLDTMLRTSVTNTAVFAPIDRDPSVGPEDPACDVHLEIRAAVTTLELDIAQFGLVVGYSPSGSHGGLTSVKGKVGVKVGAISMDFGVWECIGTECQQRVASIATHSVLGGDTSFEIDFGQVSIGPEFIWRSPLGAMLRKIMDQGIKSLVSNTRIHQLAWLAPVRDSQPALGLFTFGAGQKHGVDSSQLFEVYAATESGGSCEAYKVVAFAKPKSVHTMSTDAEIQSIFDPRGVLPGDWVMIRAKP